MAEKIDEIKRHIALKEGEVKGVEELVKEAQTEFLKGDSHQGFWEKKIEYLHSKEQQLRDEVIKLQEEVNILWQTVLQDQKRLLDVRPPEANTATTSAERIAVHCVLELDGKQVPTVVDAVANTTADILHGFCSARMIKAAGWQPLDLILKDQEGNELTMVSVIPPSNATAPLRVHLRDESALCEAPSHCSASNLTPRTLRVAQSVIGWKQQCANWPVKLPNPLPKISAYRPKAVGGKKKSDEHSNTPFFKTYLERHIINKNSNATLFDTHKSDLFGTPEGGLPLPGVSVLVSGNCDMVVCPSFVGSITPAAVAWIFILLELVHFEPLPDKSGADVISGKFTQVVGELLLVQRASKFRVYAAVGQHQETELLWFTDTRTLNRKRGPNREAVSALAGLVEKYSTFCGVLAKDVDADVPEELAAGELANLRNVRSRKRRETVVESPNEQLMQANPPRNRSLGSKAPPGGSTGTGAPLATIHEGAGRAEDTGRVLRGQEAGSASGVQEAGGARRGREPSMGCYWMRPRKRKPSAALADDEQVRNVAARAEDDGAEFCDECSEGTLGASSENSSVPRNTSDFREVFGDEESRAIEHLEMLSTIAAQGGLCDQTGGDVGYVTAAVSCGWDLGGGADVRLGRLVRQTSALREWTPSPERGSGMLDLFLQGLKEDSDVIIITEV